MRPRSRQIAKIWLQKASGQDLAQKRPFHTSSRRFLIAGLDASSLPKFGSKRLVRLFGPERSRGSEVPRRVIEHQPYTSRHVYSRLDTIRGPRFQKAPRRLPEGGQKLVYQPVSNGRESCPEQGAAPSPYGNPRVSSRLSLTSCRQTG